MDQTSDYDRLLAATGDDQQLAKELIDIFLMDYPKMMSEADLAARERRLDDLHRVAHTFKGNLRFMGAEAAAETALTIESMTVSKDLTDAPMALEQLRQQLESLAQGLITHR